MIATRRGKLLPCLPEPSHFAVGCDNNMSLRIRHPASNELTVFEPAGMAMGSAIAYAPTVEDAISDLPACRQYWSLCSPVVR